MSWLNDLYKFTTEHTIWTLLALGVIGGGFNMLIDGIVKLIKASHGEKID